MSIERMVGKCIIEVRGLENESEEVIVSFQDGSRIKFYHEQDCCESVYLLDCEGDDVCFTGALIISAEEVNDSNLIPEGHVRGELYDDSETWTFYRINTTKGEIFMRWYGSSNGYYSESVDIAWY